MEKPEAILVRHFASPLNERKVSRGWLGVGIDKEAAEKLAPGVAQTLERHGVKHLISSDLPRAKQSAEMIADHMPEGTKNEPTGKLRTWDIGSMAGKKESETIPKRQAYVKHSDETPPDGESFDDFIDRFKTGARGMEKPNTAAVVHGHHLLSAAAVFGDGHVDPKKLASLDEDHPPGSVWGVYRKGEGAELKRLDKGEPK